MVLLNYSNSVGNIDIMEGGSGSVIYYGFCTVDCISNGYFDPTGLSCVCSAYIPRCQSCTSKSNCISCGPNTYFDPLYKKCVCDGDWVLGGCTNVNYCTEINSTNGICLKCGNNYTLSSNRTSCDCLTGNPNIEGYCASIPGCNTAVFLNSKAYCVFCNKTASFYLANKTCNC